MINTSQDPEYVGATGFEKKFHKTHFEVVRTLKKTKSRSNYEWVKVAVGKYVRVRKQDARQHA